MELTCQPGIAILTALLSRAALLKQGDPASGQEVDASELKQWCVCGDLA